jgi:ribose transport system permease protein
MQAGVSRVRSGGMVRHRMRRVLVRNALLLALIVIALAFGILSPFFWTIGNVRNVALQSAILGIVAVTGGLVILTGYLDLAVGSTLALGAVIAGVLMVRAGMNPVVAVVAAVVAGALVGAVQGFLTCYLSFSPIIVTLGMLTVVRGLAFFITPDPVFSFPDSFNVLGQGSVGGIPIPVLFAAAAFLLGIIFLTKMPGGRHVYAIGVNKEAAYLTGIPVRRLPFLLYVISGISAAFGGVLMAARLNSAPPGTLGSGFELSVLTAVLLGGIAFTGGRGSIGGVLIGVVFLGVLQNGLVLLNVDYFWQLVAQGGALILAATLDAVGTYLSKTRSSRPPAAEPSPNHSSA